MSLTLIARKGRRGWPRIDVRRCHCRTKTFNENLRHLFSVLDKQLKFALLGRYAALDTLADQKFGHRASEGEKERRRERVQGQRRCGN